MSISVDLNSDMGEGFGPWTMGDDTALLDVVTSANIACGFHAGDPDVMAKTMRTAVEQGVGIGAHPGFADLQGFGRRRLDLPLAHLQNAVRYQFGAAQAMARAAGGAVRHFKLHGAMSNMACEDHVMARGLFEAALSVDPDVIIMGLAGTVMETVARDLGCRWAGEIFADRAYNDDATLVDRSEPGAVLHDPAVVTDRIVEMVRAGAIITASGKHIPTSIETICLHGDTASAVELARATRAGLIAAGITVAAFDGAPIPA